MALWISLWATEKRRIDAPSYVQISGLKKLAFMSGLMWKEGFSVAKNPSGSRACGAIFYCSRLSSAAARLRIVGFG